MAELNVLNGRNKILLFSNNKIFLGDIVCLQEVGVDYEPFLIAEMGHMGYTSVFYPKEMGTMEGLATFWKRDKFEIVDVRKLSYNAMLAEECVMVLKESQQIVHLLPSPM